MDIKRTTAIYFSPTDSTKNITLQVLDSFETKKHQIDLTNFNSSCDITDYDDEDLLIIGTAVHGGRVPSMMLPRMDNIKGKNTPVILVVVFGNRDFDDALLELKDFVEERGFVVVAAMAAIAEHSIIRCVASERPDVEDVIMINEFIGKVLWKINSSKDILDMSVDVPGNFPYRTYSGIPLKPKATRACMRCGECAKLCPVEAISFANPSKTNKDACISCMRCIKVCKNDARVLSKVLVGTFERSFAIKYAIPKFPEFFI